ncbi:hypothetical protein RhiirC2_864977 [Rhizophagus irregularis]|uniref:BTB domain-containing protein n=1 Tax=Rhizophagus irregularis TaxID=588596 RepID=A0A2N1NFC3_9GLOM|nr:hypothetical protein RhiirC2_864977 [Rhizophagus irregularis]
MATQFLPHLSQDFTKLLEKFPDLSSDIFDILIRYIYGGIINLDNKKASDILNLLTACGRFKLKELYDYVQQDLIEHHHDWLFQNLFLVQKISFKNSDFTKLQNYWTTTICEQPEILFNATDFTSVDKEALLSICKEENSCMEENELWDHIIRWGKAQNTELSEDINNWTPNNGATYNKKAYNKKIHNEGSFIVSEYEVFGITRKRQ